MKNIFDLKAMQKKGAINAKNHMETLIGALIVVVFLVAVAPEFFTGIGLINTTATGGNAPTWLPTILTLVIAAVLVFFVVKLLD